MLSTAFLLCCLCTLQNAQRLATKLHRTPVTGCSMICAVLQSSSGNDSWGSVTHEYWLREICLLLSLSSKTCFVRVSTALQATANCAQLLLPEASRSMQASKHFHKFQEVSSKRNCLTLLRKVECRVVDAEVCLCSQP